MAAFGVGDRVTVDNWYDPSEVGRIDAIEDGYMPVYHVVFDDGEYTDKDGFHLTRAVTRPLPADPRDAELAVLRRQLAIAEAALEDIAENPDADCDEYVDIARQALAAMHAAGSASALAADGTVTP